MKISEGYNVAVKKYGQEIADRMKEVGMPKAFIDTACRFYVEDGVPIETLQDDFKKWNRYVLNNPSFTAKGNNNLNVFKTYLDFKRELQKAMMPFICPNPLYNDGSLSIGELKTQRDARWFPIQNFAFPDENNDYCISKKVGGYNQFQKYHQDGCKMLIIYDKSKSSNDEFKRVLVMAKNGELRFWNNFDTPCGTTKRLNDPIWAYIDTLPHKAQIALSEFAESTLETNDMINNKNESKNMNRKNTIRLTESELKRVITESVKKVLKEGINGWNPNYKNKDGIMYDDFAEAFLRTISKTYQSPFQATQVVFEMVTQAAQICGCDYGRLMEQIKKDYENMEFYN